MRSVLLILLVFGLWGTATAEQQSFKAVVVDSGVLFEAERDNGPAMLTLKGPGNYLSRMSFGAGETPFVDITFVDGAALADGLYKYEIVAAPADRESLDALDNKRIKVSSDRNAFNGMTDPKNSPMSGSFRVVDGSIVNPYLVEQVALKAEGE